MNSTLTTTELGFEKIKENIREYFKREDSPFKDWDFEGSGLNHILNILAYNTHYNAVLTHTGFNETFLETARLRKNAVSRSKYIGYTPRSVRAPSALLDVTVQGESNTITQLSPETEFTTTLDGVTYTYSTVESFPRVGNVFPDVRVFQGSYRDVLYYYNANNRNRSFKIPSKSVDTSLLKVRVYENRSSTNFVSWTEAGDLSSINGDSTVFFLEERSDGFFEISFGDNIIGKSLDPLNVIEIRYFVTDGPASNGASSFKYSGGLIGDSQNLSKDVQTKVKSGGGTNEESIDSIRANAPLSYIAQDRAVTIEDYQSLIASLVSAESVSVWGGETNPNPVYGKVFISVKPENADFLTNLEKQDLLAKINKKNMLTIIPEIVDPEYTFIYFDIEFRFDSALTDAASVTLEADVQNMLDRFNNEFLENSFESDFRYSTFLNEIVDVDTSISSALARVYFYKRLSLFRESTTSHSVEFNEKLAGNVDQEESIVSSTGWIQNGVPHFLRDVPSNTGDGLRSILIYSKDNDGSTTVVKRNAGSLDISNGLLYLDRIKPDTNTTIKILSTPSSNDVLSQRNQLLSIDSSLTTISGRSSLDDNNNFLRTV